MNSRYPIPETWNHLIMIYWTAFTLGLFGSLHCLGMCGPIALSVGTGSLNPARRGFKVLMYNTGRILTYCFIGLLVGLLGEGIYIAGFQSQLSILLGIFLLSIAFFSWNLEKQILSSSLFHRVFFHLKSALGKMLKSGNPGHSLYLGLLNGLLPCGLVYIALFGALATQDTWSGIRYMAIFGLGTVPIMFATAWSNQFISLSWRNKLQKLYPAFLVVFGLMLIMRGVNFSLPGGM